MSKTTIGMLCVICTIPAAQAGVMGEVTHEIAPSSVFASAEGGWTWNKLNGLMVAIPDTGEIVTNKRTDRGTARVALGAKKGLTAAFAATGEIGYGYYGKTYFNFADADSGVLDASAADFSGINFRSTIDGFDVLAGLSYHCSVVDLSLKLGGLVQNNRQRANVDLKGIAEDDTPEVLSLRTDRTQVFPELKLGLAYQLINNVSVFAAWSHVFGESPGVNTMAPGFASFNQQNPTLDVFTLGAAYDFPI